MIEEEICVCLCLGGYHKYFDHMEDNELMGDDVQRIRDDYENCVREEIYYCKTCEFKSKRLEEVKKHFMVNPMTNYKLRCRECNKGIKTISEFRQHFGS